MNEDTITISRALFDELVAAQDFLARLKAAGVDNWEGYDMACEMEVDE